MRQSWDCNKQLYFLKHKDHVNVVYIPRICLETRCFVEHLSQLKGIFDLGSILSVKTRIANYRTWLTAEACGLQSPEEPTAMHVIRFKRWIMYQYQPPCLFRPHVS